MGTVGTLALAIALVAVIAATSDSVFAADALQPARHKHINATAAGRTSTSEWRGAYVEANLASALRSSATRDVRACSGRVSTGSNAKRAGPTPRGVCTVISKP